MSLSYSNKPITLLKDFGAKHYTLLVSVSIFIVAFLPRASYSVTSNLNWYGRSIRFWDAILNQNWIATYQQYHPGVPTMWLSGLGIRVFGWLRGYSSSELLAIEEMPAGVIHQAVDAGVMSLAIGISIGIVLIYLLLKELTEEKIALVSASFIAIDPFHISHSKTIHLDALISILMLITLLVLLLYRERKANWILVVAGLFTGMALLTKSPAALLIPMGTVLITDSQKLKLLNGDNKKQWQTRLWWFGTVIQKLAIWGMAAVAVFFVFWPAMWVAPLEMLVRIRDSVFVHALTSHPNQIYFNGTVSLDDPGIIFYGEVLLWRTTLITFPLLLFGLGKFIIELNQNRKSLHITLLWVFLFGAIFLLQMGISSKKGERYILPVFLPLDIVAAFGLVRLGQFINKRLKGKNINFGWGLLIGGALICQAVMVFPNHPFYGNHYNLLFGGAQQAQKVIGVQSEAEGIDLAGQYLNSLPGSSQLNVTLFSFGLDMFVQHFDGNILINDEKPISNVDYRIYYNNQVTRGLGRPGWIDSWEADQLREPTWIVEFNGIPYVWIYKVVTEN